MSQNLIDFGDPDGRWFADHKDRNLHIRRAVGQEFMQEFLSLGDHNFDRRRILLWRIPKGNPYYGRVAKIPFLAYADETIADEDHILKAILDKIMEAQLPKAGHA